MGICFLHLCEKDGTAAAGGNDPTRYEQRRGVGHLLHHLLPRGKRLSPQFALSYGCVRCGVGVGGCTLCCLAGRNCAVGFCRRSPPRSVRRRRARAIRCLQQRLSGVNEMRKQNQRQQNTEEGESLRVGVGEEKSKSEKKKIAKNPISREDGTDSSSSVAIWQTHMRGKKDKKNHTEWWGRGGGQRCALGSSAFGDPSWRGWRGAAALHPSPLLTSLTLGAVTPKAKAEEWHPDRGLPPGVRASGARPPPPGVFQDFAPLSEPNAAAPCGAFLLSLPPPAAPGRGAAPPRGTHQPRCPQMLPCRSAQRKLRREISSGTSHPLLRAALWHRSSPFAPLRTSTWAPGQGCAALPSLVVPGGGGGEGG